MTYEGWANYHTWNVALWINNEHALYVEACEFMKAEMNRDVVTYAHFVEEVLAPDFGPLTADGVSWTDPTLDHEALDEFMKGFAND